MSKQRPSGRSGREFGARNVSSAGDQGRWQRRVFHNSYTRKGRLRSVRGWSVKLQHKAVRRTLALAAQTRTAAATEARLIHDALQTGGWEAVDRLVVRGNTGHFGKKDFCYWKERLLVRDYGGPARSSAEREFSTRIDHGGIAGYFPLGTADPEAAARRALAIYQTIVEQGWEPARRQFKREVCMAFHWSYEPLLWTYTTLHTALGMGAAVPDLRKQAARRPGHLVLIETDPGLALALAECLEQQADRPCVVCGAAEAALQFGRRASLCLVNTILRERIGWSGPDRLAVLPNGVPALSYSLHADSDEVFLAPPGGISAYLLKRLPAPQMLAPIVGALEQRPCSGEALHQAAQTYFQRTLQPSLAVAPPRVGTHLTQREEQVLNLLSKGHVDKEIAQALGISAWTVHGHLKRVFEKLQVHSRIEAVLAYLQK